MKRQHPFGMLMPHRSYASTANYRFGFNEKENDNENSGLGNNSDFGARIYSPRLGKFFSSDVFSDIFPSESSYQFAGNNPINMTDFNGFFKISPWFVKRYPSLANFLKSAVPTLKNETNIRDEWIRNLGIKKSNGDFDYTLGTKLWNEMLEFGSGPYVTPNRPESEFNSNITSIVEFFGEPRGGMQPNGFPNNITVGYKYFDDLEAALKGTDNVEIGYRTFLVYIMVMHEGGHWARTKAGLSIRSGNFEDGAMAEEAIFGTRFNYTGGWAHTNQGDNALNTKKATDYYYNYLNANKPIGNTSGLFVPRVGLCWSVGSLKRTGVKGQNGDVTLKLNGDNENGNPPKREFSYDYKPSHDFYFPKR